MISAWDIYWVMQLDGIGGTLTFFTVAATVAAGLFMGLGALATDRGCYPSEQQNAAWLALKVKTKWLIVVAVSLAAVNSLIPSTKTAAMMIVVPSIANSETIQREAGDLYGIAKQALRELAKPDAKKDGE
jgi:hypothetical protein